MPSPLSGSDIAQVIQLAVAPVFLLSGVGIVLNVLTQRLARVVDRSRVLEERLPSVSGAEQADLRERLAILDRRARLVSRAIALGTSCALLISGVVVILFVGAFLGLDASAVVAILFVVAMLCFIGTLVMFLREVLLAIEGLRRQSIRRERV